MAMQEAALSSNVIQMPPTTTGQPRGMFDHPKCRFTLVGLIIEPGLPVADWVDLGNQLKHAGRSMALWRGDWIIYGKHEYGRKYDEALALTGLKEGTLRNDVWVAKTIDLSLRSDKLTRSHYMEIAPQRSKSKIRKWIERAIKGDGKRAWSVGRLRKEMNKDKAVNEAQKTVTDGALAPKEPPVLSARSRRFLDDYMGALARWSGKIPLDLPAAERETIESMIHEHGADALRLKDRTRKSDCDAILNMLKDTEDASHTGEMAAADLYDWLIKPRYFMARSDYRDRLEYMSGDGVRMALFTDAGKSGKLEESRGALPGIVCVPWTKLRKIAGKICERCQSVFEPNGSSKICKDCKEDGA